MGDFAFIVAIMLIFGAPVAAWIIHRVLSHQERMEMIRKGFIPQHGMVPPPTAPGPMPGPADFPRGSYAGPIPPPYVPDYASGAQVQLRRGITVTLIGLAVLIGLSFIRGEGGYHFGPWLIGGLVPTFVGIAQVINAVLNGARFPSAAPTRFGPAAGGTSYDNVRQAPGPQDAPPPPGSDGYAGWRPGSTPEIPRPAGPPDNR